MCFHDWFGVCSGGLVYDESDNLFLGFDQWLDVGFAAVAGSPDGDLEYEVGVDVGVVLVYHGLGAEQFVGKFEAVHDRLEFLDDVGDGEIIFSVLLDHDAKEFGFGFVFDVFAVDVELDVFVVPGVKDGVDSLGRVWD